MKFAPPRSLQLTIALIKPHAAKLPVIVDKIKNDLLDNKFFILRYRTCIMDLELAVRMYDVHKNKPFYPRLISNITSGPLVSFLLARENCIGKWRSMMGPTRAYEAHLTDPASLRGLYGVSNTRNATHGSDSPETAEKECSIFFPEFNFSDWYLNEEIYFRNGYVKFDCSQFVHVKEINCLPHLLCKTS